MFRVCRSLFLIAATAVALPLAGAARGQAALGDRVPPELEGVGVEQQIGARIPLDLPFTDQDNRDVRLSDYFNRGRPVVITLNYFRCTSLCDYQLNGLVRALQEIEFLPGREFELLTISFDPLEKPLLARTKKRNYIEEYGRLEAASGWHFLTGKNADIRTLTRRVGFGYKWNPEQEEWAHSSALIICTPDGRVARYLGGVMYEPSVLRLSLVEASGGKVGSLLDQVFLICFHYVPSEGKYAPAVMGIMRMGGGASVVGLAAWLAVLWRRDYLRRRDALAALAAGGGGVERQPGGWQAR